MNNRSMGKLPESSLRSRGSCEVTPQSGSTTRTVFLDRDGTINHEVHHLRRVEQLELLDGAAEAIRLLNDAGIRVIVVTNQAAIGRGLLTESGLEDIHVALRALLEERGARIDAIYSCPHHPTEGVGTYRVECECRKPKPGSLQRATQELDVILGSAFMVGDKCSDLEAGRAVGCRTVLVRTGYGSQAEAQLQHRAASRSPRTGPDSTTSVEARTTKTTHSMPSDGRLADHVADNLLEAALWILAQDT